MRSSVLAHLRSQARFALPVLALACALPAPLRADYLEEEYQEAYQATRDEWNAMVQTMKETKPKLEGYLRKYDEMEQFIYYQRNRKNYLEIAEFLGVDQNLAREKWDQVQEYFNQLNKAGIKGKLESAISSLGTGVTVADNVTNAWDWAEQFDPAKARDNPTHGLETIGKLLKESANTIGTVPLLGPFLKQWVEGYAFAVDEYVKALNALSKKIQENTRQGALCGQSGVWLRQQESFRRAATGSWSGENCLTYFKKPVFPRLRCEVFSGAEAFFLYHPPSERGYFSTKTWTAKVYAWHGLLLSTRALTPDWLSSRSNSMTGELESEARAAFRRARGIHRKTLPIWIIAEKLGLFQVADTYGSLEEETFVANYLLDSSVHDAIQSFLVEIDRYLFAEGTVVDADTGDPIEGAALTLTVGDHGRQIHTKAGGTWELLFEGEVGSPAALHVSHPGYRTYEETGGRFHERALLGWRVSLGKESAFVGIGGRVLNRAASPAEAVAGATVTASVSADPQTGRAAASQSTSTDDAGEYWLRLETTGSFEGARATVQATSQGARTSVEVPLTSSEHRGIDLFLDLADSVAVLTDWTIRGVVTDRHGVGVPSATVAGGSASVQSGEGGAFQLPAADVAADLAAGRTPQMEVVARVSTAAGTVVESAPVTATYEGEASSEVILVLDVDQPVAVTWTGTVVDANGIGVGSAHVTAEAAGATASAVTDASGGFSVGPLWMTRGETVAVTASLTDPTSSQIFSGGPIAGTFQGTTPQGGLQIVLEMVQESELTLQGTVLDRSGIPISNARVTVQGTAASMQGASFTASGIRHTLGQPLTVLAEVATAEGSVVTGSAEVTPSGPVTSGIAVSVDVDSPVEMVFTGLVQDAHGALVAGAIVTSDRGGAAATSPSGRFSLGPISMAREETVVLTASVTDPETGRSFSSAPVTLICEGVSPLGGTVLVIETEQVARLTISGRVIDRNGRAVGGASVEAGGVQGPALDGTFTLSGIDHSLGNPITLWASVLTVDGERVGGSTTVTPMSDRTSGAVITLNVIVDDEPDEDTADSTDVAGVGGMDGPGTGDGDGDSLDDLNEAISELGDGEPVDLDGLWAKFEAALGTEQTTASEFESYARAFEQRLREVLAGPEGIDCRELSQDLSYSLVQARDVLAVHGQDMSLLGESYAALKAGLFAASAGGRRTGDSSPSGTAGTFSDAGRSPTRADLLFTDATARARAMAQRQSEMARLLRDDYGCDEDEVEKEGEEVAESGADPDDVESGSKGTDPEVFEICGDGVDNDGDNEIDECDAGCCEGRAVIVVSDCGEAADDIFYVRLDTGATGVTPRGASTTFSDDLAPGSHSVTLQVLSAPDDIGTYCLTITVDDVVVLDVNGAPPEGTTETWNFEVPEPGAALYRRVVPVLRHDPAALSRER